MKLKPVSLIFAIFLPLVLFLGLTSNVFAQEKTQKVILIERGKVINGDYFENGDKIGIYGNIKGDLYLAGGEVIIEGNVDGDVFVVGGNIEIIGNIKGDVYAAGGQIAIGGDIAGNITTGGGNINLSDKGKANKDLNVVGGNITISTPISGDLRVAGGSVTLAGPVAENVVAGTGNLRLSRGSKINGNLTYTSGEKASIATDATIAGRTNYFIPQHKTPKPKVNTRALAGGTFGAMLASGIATFVIGLILIQLFPKYIQNGVSILRDQPWSTLFYGLAVIILTPIILILIFITILGIPLSLISLMIYIVTLYVSRIFAMTYLGEWVLKSLNVKKKSLGWIFTTGVLSYYLLGIIPFVGGLATLISTILGLGIITKSILNQNRGRLKN